MSRSSHLNGHLPYSSFPSPLTINSFTIPRSYNHSSDESETGSPSGAGPYGSPSPSHGTQNPQSQEDAPFVPRRAHRTQHQPGGTRADVALSPDTQNNYEYGGIQPNTPAGGYLHHNRGGYVGTYHQPTHTHGVCDSDRGEWRGSPGSPPESHYRSQVSNYPTDQNYQPGANYNHGTSTYDLPRPPTGQFSSQQTPAYDGPNNHAVGHHPSVFVSSTASTEDYLRHQLNIPPYQAVNLFALPDPPPGQRPSQPLPVLIKLAIHGSPKKKLTLREIYLALEERFVWFRENQNDKAWKGSIRHNLSLNKVFRNVQRPITEPGKGKYWVLDITQGEGYKRERKRRNKKTRLSDGEEDEDEDDGSDDDGACSSSAGSPVASIGIPVQQLDPQSGPHRVRSSTPRGTSPYAQPAGSSGNTFSSQGGYGGGPMSTPNAPQHHVDASAPQTGFSRATFGETTYRFGEPSLVSGTRTYSQPTPTLMHQGQRPVAHRSSTLPPPRTFSPSSSGEYGGMGSFQSVSAPGMLGTLPMRRSAPGQQLMGFDGMPSCVAATMHATGGAPQYGQNQYNQQICNYPSDQGGHGRGRTL